MRRSGSPSLPLPAARAAPAKSRGGRFFLVWWAIYLITSPIYVFESGLPQPADALLAAMIAILATGFALRIPVHRDLYLAGATFLSWVAIVNWFWWTQYDDPMFLFSSVYYVYNFSALLVVFTLFHKMHDDFMAVTRIALIGAMAVELVSLIVLSDVQGVRATGTFNNPNQLGYWSLLLAACYLVTRGQTSFKWLDLLVLCALAYTAALSLSKAAILSILALLGFALWFQGVGTRLKLALSTAVVLTSFVVLVEPTLLESLIGRGLSGQMIERLSDIGQQSDDNLTARGYDRIWLSPEYLLAGAGEGAFERFTNNNEMHSTFGTILFSYGVPGAASFLLLLWVIFRHAALRHVMYFVPTLLYGLTHQGLRFSLFWILLALIFCSAQHQRRKRATGPRAPILDLREKVRT